MKDELLVVVGQLYMDLHYAQKHMMQQENIIKGLQKNIQNLQQKLQPNSQPNLQPNSQPIEIQDESGTQE